MVGLVGLRCSASVLGERGLRAVILWELRSGLSGGLNDAVSLEGLEGGKGLSDSLDLGEIGWYDVGTWGGSGWLSVERLSLKGLDRGRGLCAVTLRGWVGGRGLSGDKLSHLCLHGVNLGTHLRGRRMQDDVGRVRGGRSERLVVGRGVGRACPVIGALIAR